MQPAVRHSIVLTLGALTGTILMERTRPVSSQTSASTNCTEWSSRAARYASLASRASISTATETDKVRNTQLYRFIAQSHRRMPKSSGGARDGLALQRAPRKALSRAGGVHSSAAHESGVNWRPVKRGIRHVLREAFPFASDSARVISGFESERRGRRFPPDLGLSPAACEIVPTRPCRDPAS